MPVRYSGHWLKTRRQAVWQTVVVTALLVPLAAWRFSLRRPGLSVALAVLALAPASIAYQAWRFLENAERVHAEPTPEMAFVFRFLVSTPLALSGPIFVLLVEVE